MLLAEGPDGAVRATEISDAGEPAGERLLANAELGDWVAERERQHPRWVWHDTAYWYPRLLQQGVRVERCHDLRLCHAILRNSVFASQTELATAEEDPWDSLPAAQEHEPGALFDLRGEDPAPDPLAEFRRQRSALASSEPGGHRLGLLLAAESAGALAAAEMSFAGLPWRADVHDAVLTELLGARPASGARPARLQELLAVIRHEFGDPGLNPDSPPELVKSLRRAGLNVSSTRSWELERIEHPGIRPLLEYKKLARLASANGWHWLDTWVRDGRFRPVYIPGGVVTGRWASNGGGALQLPAQVRPAVVADEGWKLVVADAAQLEPRVLAGLSGDTALAAAAKGSDLYAGIVEAGAVETREQAKYGVLGAMYGGTKGESGRVAPRLAKAYPRAIALVESAARAGERGERVSSLLGRSSPSPDAAWRDSQQGAFADDATDADERRARSQAKAWGRFTRNFVVQSTAAEWALCWMASLRNGLWRTAEGPFTARPHLAFFLHDEVIVHTPADLADEVAGLVAECAAEAGRLLFGDFPLDFPVTVSVVDTYAAAK